MLFRSFHGRTLFTVTAGGQAKYSTGFGPNPAGITHLPYNDVAALEREFAEHGSEICAVLLEPMQGEGGMLPGTAEYLQAARTLCTAHGLARIQTSAERRRRANHSPCDCGLPGGRTVTMKIADSGQRDR